MCLSRLGLPPSGIQSYHQGPTARFVPTCPIQERKNSAIFHCFHAYSALEDSKGAEEAVRMAIVAPIVEKVISAHSIAGVRPGANGLTISGPLGPPFSEPFSLCCARTSLDLWTSSPCARAKTRVITLLCQCSVSCSFLLCATSAWHASPTRLLIPFL